MHTFTFPLIDERAVAQVFRLRREVKEPEDRTGGPVIRDGRAYGSVLRDNEQWRMWYLKEPFYCEYYATSQNGVDWEIPELDLVNPAVREGLSGPNAFMTREQKDLNGNWLVGLKGPQGFCVLDATQTPHPQARERYMALYLARFQDEGGVIHGLCLAHSGDGLHWVADERNPISHGWRDTANMVFFDTRTKRYVLFGRPEVRVSSVSECNRLLCRLESEDLTQWSPERVVLDTDDVDADAFAVLDEALLHLGHQVTDPQKRAEVWATITEGARAAEVRPVFRGRNRQWYGINAFPYRDLYVALGWMYDLASGRIWIELLHSADSVHWQREPRRMPYIPAQAGRWDSPLLVTMSSPPVEVGDEFWIYYSAAPKNHHGVMAADADTVPRGIGVRVLKRDRWVGYVAGAEEGELLTAVLPRRNGLAFNLATEASGYVRTAILDADGKPLQGFSLEESEPLSGDELRLEPRWTSGCSIKDIPTEAVRIRCVLRRAELYAVHL